VGLCDGNTPYLVCEGQNLNVCHRKSQHLMFSGYPLRNCETPFETGLPPLESANLENELSQGLNTAMYMNTPKILAKGGGFLPGLQVTY